MKMISPNYWPGQRGVYLAGEPNKQVLCAVCNDLASGRHCGVFTCEGCKCFFKRSHSQKGDLKCQSGGTCMVNKYLRKQCRACRFKKCRMVGMRPEAIKKGRPPKNLYSSRALNIKRFESHRRLVQLMDEIESEFVDLLKGSHQLGRDIPCLDTYANKFDSAMLKAEFEEKHHQD